MSTATPREMPRFQGRVLVVDDVPDAADALVLLLGLFEVQADVAYSGRDALRRFETTAYDLALIDTGMPDVDGDALALRVRERSASPRPWLVALSAWGPDATRPPSTDFDEHLSKPLSLETVRQLLLRRSPGAPKDDHRR